MEQEVILIVFSFSFISCAGKAERECPQLMMRRTPAIPIIGLRQSKGAACLAPDN
jgi:hypothetical protein